MSSDNNRFEFIEIGRGIAALLVVCFHATGIIGLPKYFGQAPLSGIFSFGYAGVDFFFVLSGFIIFYSTSKNHANFAAVSAYVKHRLIRIYPIYWVVGRSRYRGGKTKTLQIYKAGDYFEKKLENNP